MNKYKKSNILIAFFLLLAIIMYGSCGVIYATTTTSVTNNFATGLVRIDLTQYESQDGELVEIPDDYVTPNIVPNQRINRIERIQNKAADCYIRLYQDFDIKDVFTVSVNSSDWFQASDGYIYYKNVLKEGELADLDLTLLVSPDLDKSLSEQIVKQYVKVEAVQSANFTPNFDSEYPWGNVTILDAIYEKEYSSGMIGKQSLSIAYKGDSKTLVKNADDAFINFATLMPGDVYSDTLVLSNDSSNPINLYFKSTVNGDSKLYDAIQLKIDFVYNGKTTNIFDGPLSDSQIKNNLLLAEIASKDGGSLNYILYFPESYDNEYTLMNGNITWIFSTDEVEDNDEIIKTGDNTMIMTYLIVIGSICLVVAFFIYYKSKEEDKKVVKVEAKNNDKE